MVQTDFTVHARGGLQGEQDVHCDVSDIAVLWEKTHQASQSVVTVVKTRDGAQLQSNEPFDAIYAKIQQSGVTFVDAVSTDDADQTMYFLNVDATDVLEGSDRELRVSTAALRNTTFFPMNEQGVPYSLEQYQAMMPNQDQRDDNLETVF